MFLTCAAAEISTTLYIYRRSFQSRPATACDHTGVGRADHWTAACSSPIDDKILGQFFSRGRPCQPSWPFFRCKLWYRWTAGDDVSGWLLRPASSSPAHHSCPPPWWPVIVVGGTLGFFFVNINLQCEAPTYHWSIRYDLGMFVRIAIWLGLFSERLIIVPGSFARFFGGILELNPRFTRRNNLQYWQRVLNHHTVTETPVWHSLDTVSRWSVDANANQ